MRVLVLAVGRMKKGAEADLAARYLKRALQAGRNIGIRDIEIVEIRESRAQDAERRKLEEAIAHCQCGAGQIGDRAAGRTRRAGQQHRFRRTISVNGATADRRPSPLSSAAPTDLAKASRPRRKRSSVSGRRHGRTKWSGLCFWNSSTGLSQSCRGTHITANKSVSSAAKRHKKAADCGA